MPGDFPDFYYAFDIWQYSFEETIPGIETPTDMNLMFIPKGATLAVTVCGGDASDMNPVIIIY